MEKYRTAMMQSQCVNYQNVVILQDKSFVVENHVHDDGEVYEMPLQAFNNIDEAIAYANAN